MGGRHSILRSPVREREAIRPGIPRPATVPFDPRHPVGRKHSTMITSTGGEGSPRSCYIDKHLLARKDVAGRLRTLHSALLMCSHDWDTRFSAHDSHRWDLNDYEWASDLKAYKRTKDVLDSLRKEVHALKKRGTGLAADTGDAQRLVLAYRTLRRQMDQWASILQISKVSPVPFPRL